MIKLTNIQKSDDFILCRAFVEDSKSGVDLKYNVRNDEFENFTLPVGYEWCLSHITHAKRFLRTLKEKSDCPNEELIMWY